MNANVNLIQRMNVPAVVLSLNDSAILSRLKQRLAAGDRPLSMEQQRDIAQMLDAVLQRSVRADQPWTAVNERLPRPQEFVLATGPSGCASLPNFFVAAQYSKVYRPHAPWCGVDRTCLSDCGWEPTHWMPLPSAPLAPFPVYPPSMSRIANR